MLSLLALILLDPLCLFAALSAALYGLTRFCLKKNENTCPVRICDKAQTWRNNK